MLCSVNLFSQLHLCFTLFYTFYFYINFDIVFYHNSNPQPKISCLIRIIYSTSKLPFFQSKKKPVRLIIQPAPALNPYKLPNLILELPDNLHMLRICYNNLFNKFLHHCLCQFICSGILLHHTKCLR